MSQIPSTVSLAAFGKSILRQQAPRWRRWACVFGNDSTWQPCPPANTQAGILHAVIIAGDTNAGNGEGEVRVKIGDPDNQSSDGGGVLGPFRSNPKETGLYVLDVEFDAGHIWI